MVIKKSYPILNEETGRKNNEKRDKSKLYKYANSMIMSI
jgi:hypothetical protein